MEGLTLDRAWAQSLRGHATCMLLELLTVLEIVLSLWCAGVKSKALGIRGSSFAQRLNSLA